MDDVKPWEPVVYFNMISPLQAAVSCAPPIVDWSKRDTKVHVILANGQKIIVRAKS